MQTLESLGVPASAFLIPHNMPEGQGWVHPPQGYNPSMDQGVVGMSPQQNSHMYVMNGVKPEQSPQQQQAQPQPQRREDVLTSPPPPAANPSVITATYNPTYNRCLPKILSDLDCEMKIKQVLRCIENILLENGDVDLQQQAYKLPDRSSSPQFAKTKKPKFKEDEDMQSPSINLPLATNSPATLINKGVNNKNPIKIAVKVEPDDKSPGMRAPFINNNEQVPTTSPRAQMFDFSYKPQQSPQQAAYSPMVHTPQQRQFGYENFPNGGHPAQPMIPHLSMSSPHLNASTSSPHLHHLHASSPHLHAGHVHSPHVGHSPLHAGHTNSPHLAHSPHPHSPMVHSPMVHSPMVHSPQTPQGVLSPPQHIPVQQFQVITRPRDEAHAQEPMSQDYHGQYQPAYDGGVQAGGFKQHHEADPHHPPPQPKKEPNLQDFVLDPALFAQYLAANQQQLQNLQQQLHQQQIQHSQLQQQRLHQHAPQPQQAQQPSHPHHPQQHHPQTQPQQPAQSQQQAQPQSNQQPQQHQQQPQQPQQPAMAIPPHLVGDPAHPITLSGHLPMSLSGHFFQNIGPEGGIPEDDKWILSLLNTDSSIAHDLSLSGHIPPL